MDHLKELSLEINRSLENRNFTDLSDKFIEYQKLTNSVNQGIPGALYFYNNTLRAKKEAATMMLLLETRDLGPDQQKELQELKTAYIKLDTISRPGLTTNDYGNISATYQILTQRLRNLMKSQDENPLYFAESKFRAFARRVGQSLSGALNAASVPPSTLSTNPNRLLLFTGITFLSLVSLFGFILISIFASLSKFSRLSMVGGAIIMAVFVFIALIFSGSLYYFLDKTTHESMLNEFLLDLEPRKDVAILIDATRVNANVSSVMFNCAQTIGNSLTSQNKTVRIFHFEPQGCREPGSNSLNAENSSECAAFKTATSLFLLNYSSQARAPRLSTIFDNRLELAGDKNYFQLCSISAIFQK